MDTEDVQGESIGEKDPGMSGRKIPGTDIPEPSAELGVVYFDFDKSEIRGDQRSTLKKNAKTITGSEWVSVTVQGYCDERGSEEYNLALGERRANAVKRYLVDLGVPRAKLKTVSFGEEHPAVRGHDESAWRYNRRAEFAVNQ
ncbi:MAG: peptidoglycan-associated lipoprotein Pal [Deltaproteobacteria bacterium]|nr:MAG: peptidoglycan-associated lipoprotein Pal [Deltaproteobacteria bacterium]